MSSSPQTQIATHQNVLPGLNVQLVFFTLYTMTHLYAQFPILTQNKFLSIGILIVVYGCSTLQNAQGQVHSAMSHILQKKKPPPHLREHNSPPKTFSLVFTNGHQ